MRASGAGRRRRGRHEWADGATRIRGRHMHVCRCERLIGKAALEGRGVAVGEPLRKSFRGTYVWG